MGSTDLPLRVAVSWIVFRDEDRALADWAESRHQRLPLAHGDDRSKAWLLLRDALRRGEITALGRSTRGVSPIPAPAWYEVKLGMHGSADIAFTDAPLRAAYTNIVVDGLEVLARWKPVATADGKRRTIADETRAVRAICLVIQQDRDQSLRQAQLKAMPECAGFGPVAFKRVLAAAVGETGAEYLRQPGRPRRAQSAGAT